MVVLLVIGGAVLIINRGQSTPTGAFPAHLATNLNALPASSRIAAAHTVELTITTPGHFTYVAALVLPHDLAVTTTAIPVNAMITGSSATKIDFPVTLVGRDNVMGFSIVRLSVPIPALALDPLPSSTAVIVVAPVEKGSSLAPEYHWSMTTLGDPLNDAQGVVRYLATKSDTRLSNYVDAIAIDKNGRVVAVLSSRHFWYSARFVAQVAEVVATGRGCHATLGIKGASVQGGGVLVTKVTPFSSAAHAGVSVGDVITRWNGIDLDSWDQLVSSLYLTPAYSNVHFTYMAKSTEHHAYVALGCDI
jgi:hypothetical protein